jgi:TonB-dependent siderophore receptor
MNDRLRLLGTGLVLAFLLSAPTRAAGAPAQPGPDEEPRQPADEFTEYVEVQDSSLPSSSTIATKLPLPLAWTPANVGAVGSPMLYEQDAALLGDALRNVSGLNVQNGSGVHDFFSVRGFDSVSSSLVMSDGAAEPEVTSYPLYNVEGVEVFKGPAGFLYGKNALAGAVNLVRKQPLPGDFTVLGASGGSHDTVDGALDWNAATDDGALSFRLNSFWLDAGGYRDLSDREHWGVNPGLTWRPDEASRLSVGLEYVDAQYSPDNGIPLYQNRLPDVARRRSYQGAADFSDQTLGRFQVDYERRLGDRTALRGKTYYRDLDWRSDGTLLRFTLDDPVVPGQIQVVRDLAVLDDRQQFAGTQLELVLELATGGVEHKLLTGLELVHESDEYTFALQPQQDVDLESGQPTILDLGSPPSTSFGDVTNRVIAPYVVDQMKLSGRVELLVGARYDSIENEGDVQSLVSPPVSYSRDDSELSPMAGVVFAATPRLSFYANAARSYAPPSTRLVDEVDPAHREPERGTQFEVGARQQFLDGKVRTTLAVYELERDNIAIADQTFFAQQSGDQRSRGIELELAAEPRPRLRTFVSYAFTDAELTEFTPFDFFTEEQQDYSGNDPIMAPEHLANAWVSKSFDGGLGVAGGARYVGEQFISENNAYTLDAALILDAALFYDRKGWRFKLNLKNLADEEYETRGIAGDASIVPADPFSVYGGIEYRR